MTRGRPFFWLLLITAGIAYAFVHAVRIDNATLAAGGKAEKTITLPYKNSSRVSNETFVFSFTVMSRIAQEKKLFIAADDEILSVRVNGRYVSIENVKARYRQTMLKDYRRGYDFLLPLVQGANRVVVKTKNYGKGNYAFKVDVKPKYFDYAALFLLIFVPLIVLAVNALDRYIGKIKTGVGRINSMRIFSAVEKKGYLSYLPTAIIFLGIVLRLAYFLVYGHASYQHDQNDHIEFIRYFSTHWELPLPDKAVEFPQQPLYYFITGKIMALLLLTGLPENDIFRFIASLSTVMMSAVLLIGYQVLKVLSDSRFVINTALAFLAFTPSLLFLSGQINNDPLNYFLATLAIYYIVQYDRSGSHRDFSASLFLSVLVFLTKVSSGMVSILLFVVLLRHYFLSGTQTVQKRKILLYIKIFAVTVSFFLGLSLLRVYLPSTGELLFVNSGVFKGQEIHALDLHYFLSFNIVSLINEGQAYVYDTDFMPVKQSFFTWQYATMLLGEYDYNRVMDTLFFNRLVYFFSLIYVVGIASFVFYFKKMPPLVKVFAALVVVNELLIVNFAFSFPSVCNTDFRYNSPTILLWSIIVAFGLSQLVNHAKRLQRPIVSAVVLAGVSQIAWTVYLLILARENTIT